jgi:hypothetical protein
MRLLIDECLNWRLARALTGHYAVSAQKQGWGGIKNGALLALAEKEFDVFITGDRNLSFQQDVTKLSYRRRRPSRPQHPVARHPATDPQSSRRPLHAQTRPSPRRVSVVRLTASRRSLSEGGRVSLKLQ